MSKAKLFRWIIPVVLLAIVSVAAKSGLISFGQAQKINGPAVSTVTVAEARSVAKIPKITLTGSVEGETSVVISAKISGRIEQVLVEEGQAVAAGQQLIGLESVELVNTVRVNSDGVRRAAANYDNAATDYERYQALFRQNAISRQQLDSVETRMKVAQAELSSAHATLSIAEQQHAYAAVSTPISGVVANKTATIGQVVSAGMPLMTVENIRQVYAVVNIEQKDLGVVKPGLPAEVIVDTYPGQVFSGKVEIINPAAGTANRMFRVKIKVDNVDGFLKPGMFVKVRLIVGAETQVLAVPQSAIFQKQGLYYLYRLDGEKVARHQVEVGSVLGEYIEVKSGITVGQPVVTSNVNNLKDGDPVRIAK